MATIKISGLPAAAALGVGDLVPVVQGAATKKATFTQVLDLVFASLGHILPIARGGTGQAVANDALNALLPAQAGQATKFLQTNGANATWQAASGGVSSLASAGGSITVSAAVGAVDVSLNLAHANAWATGQTVASSGGSVRTVSLCGSGTVGAVEAACTTGTASAAVLAQNNRAGEFTNANGVQAYLADGVAAAQFGGGLVICSGGLTLATSFGAFGAAAVGQQASGGALVDATGGAVTGTLNAVAGTGDDATVNGNFASLAAKVETIRAGLALFGWFN
jgi:hypothetical protein